MGHGVANPVTIQARLRQYLELSILFVRGGTGLRRRFD
jgi:hypothetical protein